MLIKKATLILNLKFITFFFLAWHQPIEASDTYAVYGIGSKQCGEYLADREKSGNRFDTIVAAQYSDWTQGFISGYNSATPKQQVTTSLPRATVIAFIDKYCRDNPLGAVVGAVECLRANYSGQKPQHCK
jgi:hypothetical protein